MHGIFQAIRIIHKRLSIKSCERTDVMKCEMVKRFNKFCVLPMCVRLTVIASSVRSRLCWHHFWLFSVTGIVTAANADDVGLVLMTF